MTLANGYPVALRTDLSVPAACERVTAVVVGSYATGQRSVVRLDPEPLAPRTRRFPGDRGTIDGTAVVTAWRDRDGSVEYVLNGPSPRIGAQVAVLVDRNWARDVARWTAGGLLLIRRMLREDPTLRSAGESSSPADGVLVFEGVATGLGDLRRRVESAVLSDAGEWLGALDASDLVETSRIVRSVSISPEDLHGLSIVELKQFESAVWLRYSFQGH